MKLIERLTDETVLGTPGLSHAQPRCTARAIVKNRQGLYALMYAEKFDLYSLPGGGVEGEERPVDALRREIFEETGCLCQEIEALGIVEENRFHADYTQISYYYLVTTDGPQTDPELTEAERQNRTSLQWHPLEEVIRRITTPVHSTAQRKFLQARDTAALNAYLQRESHP